MLSNSRPFFISVFLGHSSSTVDFAEATVKLQEDVVVISEPSVVRKAQLQPRSNLMSVVPQGWGFFLEMEVPVRHGKRGPKTGYCRLSASCQEIRRTTQSLLSGPTFCLSSVKEQKWKLLVSMAGDSAFSIFSVQVLPVPRRLELLPLC